MEKQNKHWYDVVLEYLGNPQTYQVVLTMLVAFGVKIDVRLQDAITKLGMAIAQLGTAIEELVMVIKEIQNAPKNEEKK